MAIGRLSEGLKLHYRDYAGDASRPPILCIPGLTRNARDFEGVAGRLAGDWRLICVDLRGRGGSEFARDVATDVPPVYLQDLEALFAALGLERFVLFGTSLGGLLTMLLSMRRPERIAAALLNDIGPVIETSGLDYIRSYVGRPQNWPTWLHAARFLARGAARPLSRLDARRLARFRQAAVQADAGRPRRAGLRHAHRRAVPRRPPAKSGLRPVDRLCRPSRASPRWWCAAGFPTCSVRRRSNGCSPRIRRWRAVTVPRAGHAPTLEEPEAAQAIDRLLGRVQ